MPTKVHMVKAMVFRVVMYNCESWTIKKAEPQRIDAFELCCWRRLLRVPWTARSNQKILKEINPEYSLEGLMLKLKLQYSGHLIGKASTLEKKPWCWKRLRAGKEGVDRGWDGWMHHGLNGHEFEQTLGEGEGGMVQENSIEPCILSRVKQITSPGWMHETSTHCGFDLNFPDN